MYLAPLDIFCSGRLRCPPGISRLEGHWWRRMTFLVLLALGVLMAVIYLPLRVYLTLTARSRRLKLLQRIRQLRQQLGEDLKPEQGTAG